MSCGVGGLAVAASRRCEYGGQRPRTHATGCPLIAAARSGVRLVPQLPDARPLAVRALCWVGVLQMSNSGAAARGSISETRPPGAAGAGPPRADRLRYVHVNHDRPRTCHRSILCCVYRCWSEPGGLK